MSTFTYECQKFSLEFDPCTDTTWHSGVVAFIEYSAMLHLPHSLPPLDVAARLTNRLHEPEHFSRSSLLVHIFSHYKYYLFLHWRVIPSPNPLDRISRFIVPKDSCYRCNEHGFRTLYGLIFGHDITIYWIGLTRLFIIPQKWLLRVGIAQSV
jgi:hypothetical protein